MKIRKMEESDKPLLAEWTNEGDHKGYDPEWIFPKDARYEGMMLLDDQGPLLGFRISKVLRVDIEFNPDERIRTAKALISGFQWLLNKAKAAGFREVIFESHSKPLISFCKKRFGFFESREEIKVVI